MVTTELILAAVGAYGLVIVPLGILIGRRLRDQTKP